MAEIDVQNDLDAVNNQLATMAEELRKIESARENVVMQIANLNGVSMYLRGKVATDEAVVAEASDDSGSLDPIDDLSRTTEIPE
tara:strand:- start:29180 stop:29431 length:252 start_codon:yes stop_codon:yes gene_type:complete